jgi:hypothetical protein
VVPAPWRSTPIVRRVAIAGSRRDRGYSLPITQCLSGARPRQRCGPPARRPRARDRPSPGQGRVADIGNELLEATIGAPGGRLPFGAAEVEVRSRASRPPPAIAAARYGSRMYGGPRARRRSPSPARGAVYFRGRAGPVGAMADVKLLLSPTRAQLRTRYRAASCHSLISQQDSNGYRIARVNSHRESRPSESDFMPPAPAQGAQLSVENGGIPGLQRVAWRAERASRK